MKKLFAVNKYLPVALALDALTAAGSAPAFAQAAGYFGGPLPLHYLSGGSKASGWTVEAAKLRPANTQSIRNNGLSAFAKVAATTDYYNTVSSSLGSADRFSEASQR